MNSKKDITERGHITPSYQMEAPPVTGLLAYGKIKTDAEDRRVRKAYLTGRGKRLIEDITKDLGNQ